MITSAAFFAYDLEDRVWGPGCLVRTDSHSARHSDMRHAIDVEHRHGLLDVLDRIRRHLAQDPYRSPRAPRLVGIDAKPRTRTNRFAHPRHDLHVPLLVDADLEVDRVKPALDGISPLGDHVLERVLGLYVVHRRERIPERPAEEHRYRLPEVLSGSVPECHLDTTEDKGRGPVERKPAESITRVRKRWGANADSPTMDSAIWLVIALITSGSGPIQTLTSPIPVMPTSVCSSTSPTVYEERGPMPRAGGSIGRFRKVSSTCSTRTGHTTSGRGTTGCRLHSH